MIRMPTALLLLTIVSGAWAGEPPGPVDDALIDELLGDAPAARAGEEATTPGLDAAAEPAGPGGGVDEEAVARVAEGLAEAKSLLGARETGERTRAAQRKAVDGLAKLIAAAKDASSKPSPGGSGADGSGDSQPRPDGPASPEEAGPGGSAADVGPDGPGHRNREGKAEESSDRETPGSPRDVVREFRSDLARDAWGHLPERYREQLLNAESDRTLPRYGDLVRRYFESLAQPGAEGTD